MSVECLALTNKPGYWIVWHTISYPSTGFAFPPPPPSKGLSESKIPHPTPLSSDGVATIHTEISPGDIARRIRQEKGHRAHEILASGPELAATSNCRITKSPPKCRFTSHHPSPEVPAKIPLSHPIPSSHVCISLCQ